MNTVAHTPQQEDSCNNGPQHRLAGCRALPDCTRAARARGSGYLSSASERQGGHRRNHQVIHSPCTTDDQFRQGGRSYAARKLQLVRLAHHSISFQLIVRRGVGVSFVSCYTPLTSHSGQDDYFTSTLPDSAFEETFKKLTSPLALIFSGADQFVPASVDKEALAKRMQKCGDERVKISVVVPDAKHDYEGGLDGSKPTEKLIDVVVSFVRMFD